MRSLLVVVAGVLTWSSAHAAEPPGKPVPSVPQTKLLDTPDPADAEKVARRVVLLPVRAFDGTVQDLFRMDAARSAGSVAATRVDTALSKALKEALYVDGLTRDVLRDKLRLRKEFPIGTLAALSLYRVGLEHYLALQTDRAIGNLKNAERFYDDVYETLVDPAALGDVLLILGVSHIEQGEPELAHLAFKRLFLHQPQRHVKKGFFPERIEQALAAALVDFNASGPKDQPLGSPDRLEQLGADLGLDVMIHGAVTAEAGRLDVRLYAWDRQKQTQVMTERFAADAHIEERVDRFISRLLCCTTLAMRTPEPPPMPRFRLDTDIAGSIYGRHPARRLWTNLGFGMTFAHVVRPGFELFASTQLYTSVLDPYRDLLRSFNSVRFVIGPGFHTLGETVRFFAHPGLDLHLLGRFVASTDPNCKLFGTSHPQCSGGSLTDLDGALLIGVNLTLGTHISIGRSFFVAIKPSISAYFLPLDGKDKLNFPLSFETGLGYVF